MQSPSWEANWFAAIQEIPCISRNPKGHYRTHNRPPPVSILGQPNPVHIPTSHLPAIHPNIINPSTPRSPQWSPSLRFPHQHPIHPSPHPYIFWQHVLNFRKIHPVGDEFSHADGKTEDRQSEMRKLIVVFHSFLRTCPTTKLHCTLFKVKINQSRYRPVVAQRVPGI